ncbi:MAG: alpha/beta hydrolase [Actinomycetota bacterium]
MSKGRVVRPVFESKVLRKNPLGDPTDRETPVYLPPTYDDSSTRYPLIIALTGFMGTGRMLLNEAWIDEALDERLDRLIATKQMDEAIVMMPDCATRYGGSQYIDSEATGAYATYLIEELIAWVDATFRTIPDRDARGVFGKSSGGYGSIRSAMDFPDEIGAFACHSGDMAFEYGYTHEFPQAVRYLSKHKLTPKTFLDDYRSLPDKSPAFFATLDTFAMASCYSPNESSEWGFDLPFDIQTGSMIDEVWSRWLSHDPIRMIPSKIDALRSQRLVYLDCGTKDEWYLDIGARQAAALLASNGVEVLHEEFDAGHMNIPYRYDRSLPLISNALIKPGG